MTDESRQSYPATINTLLDNATGPLGYYGVFTANMHTDTAIHGQWSAIVESAQAHGVPIVSARQMLDWLDGRNSSSFGDVSFSGNVLGFTVDRDRAGDTGCRAWCPRRRPKAALVTTITRNGSPVTFTVETRKGDRLRAVRCAEWCVHGDVHRSTRPPPSSRPSSRPRVPAGTATITWTTDEPPTSRVDYGTTAGSLSTSSASAALVTAHSRTLTGLTPGATYFFRVTSTDAHDNAAISPAAPAAPASFALPLFVDVDSTLAELRDRHARRVPSGRPTAGTARSCSHRPAVRSSAGPACPPAGRALPGAQAAPQPSVVACSPSTGHARASDGACSRPGARSSSSRRSTPRRSQHVGFGDRPERRAVGDLQHRERTARLASAHQRRQWHEHRHGDPRLVVRCTRTASESIGVRRRSSTPSTASSSRRTRRTTRDRCIRSRATDAPGGASTCRSTGST